MTNFTKMHLKQTNVVYKFICPFPECLLKNKNNFYIGRTTTTSSCRLTYHLSENSAIKQYLIIKYNNINSQLTSSNIRKILTDNIIIIYKNNNKKTMNLDKIKLKITCIYIYIYIYRERERERERKKREKEGEKERESFAKENRQGRIY